MAESTLIVNGELLASITKLKPEVNYDMNDKGNGELFAEIYKDKARYNVTAKQWYVYDGIIWKEDTEGMYVSRLAKALFDSLLVYAVKVEDKIQQQYIEHVTRLGRLRNRRTMIEDAKDKYSICNDDLDKDIYLLNCKNCVIDLKTFEVLEHDADLLLSKVSNIEYEPTAECELFLKFIKDVMQDDKEKIEYIQKLLGYSLTGDTREETCYILYGNTTRNGKSTLVETISYMLGNEGGYSMNTNPETLAQKQNKDSRQASGDIARLKGTRFLNASEPPKKMIFDVGLLKNLLGRDSITARHLHEREFQFIPCFKLFINTNFLPLITDDTLFSSGRINVITFDRHFKSGEQDKTLKDKLKTKESISGIFNWCLDGLKKYYKEGAEPPQCVKESTLEYRKNSDKIGNFIIEVLEESTLNSMAKDVYDAYQEWCKDNGYGSENKRNFFAELKSKNIFANTGTVNGKTERNVVMNYIIASEWKESDVKGIFK
jgi:putative DNA primase/helicase